MNMTHIHNLDDAVGLAAQIVFEYPDWSVEHCSDMIQSYDDTGESPPCDYDDLYYICHKIDKLKKEGYEYHDCMEFVLREMQKTK